MHKILIKKFILLTFRKSRNQMTSGRGSPITSHIIITVSPSYASLERGLTMNNGSLEYLKDDDETYAECINNLKFLTAYQVQRLKAQLEIFCLNVR